MTVSYAVPYAVPYTVSYREMLQIFGRIGLLSFGGPAAQLALKHRELVETHRWLDEQTFLRALSLCMLMPGPEAMQLATYARWRLRGVPGGVPLGLLFVLPGALVIAVLVALYAAFGQLAPVQAAFLGIKAAVIIIVLQALRKVAGKALKTPSAWAIAALSFGAIFAFGLPFPLIIAVAALWGFFTSSAAIPPVPAQPVTAQPLRTALIWLTLWLAPLVALSLTGQTLLADLGWFFARLAVVTFGGAYAVLAYMTQTVVDQYHWIDTAQMIDALGLAETTPGAADPGHPVCGDADRAIARRANAGVCRRGHRPMGHLYPVFPMDISGWPLSGTDRRPPAPVGCPAQHHRCGGWRHPEPVDLVCPACTVWRCRPDDYRATVAALARMAQP
ncbi:MAG: putative chromate ion transporter [Paracoccaceae bacterium]|jgi:putative chromate ion transporter